MPLAIANPYAEPGTPWLKGNLHAHTTESDGSRAPQEVIDDYAARGHDFMMLSDHDKLTAPSLFNDRGMILIPGNEVSANGPHLLHVNAQSRIEPLADRQQVIGTILKEKGAFAVINHPNWKENFNHCPQENLQTWEGYLGIEVYNGVIRRLHGSPLASDRWDMLLHQGRHVWGFANDDSHTPEDVNLAWNVVQSKQRTLAGVLEAFVAGRFYGSTGVDIETIAVHGRTIHVRAPKAQRMVVVGHAGKRETHCDAPEITYHVPENTKNRYVRIECYGPGESMAWTQPFWIS